MIWIDIKLNHNLIQNAHISVQHQEKVLEKPSYLFRDIMTNNSSYLPTVVPLLEGKI